MIRVVGFCSNFSNNNIPYCDWIDYQNLNFKEIKERIYERLA